MGGDGRAQLEEFKSIVFATVTAVTFVASGPTYLLGAPFDDVVAHLPTYPWGRFADNRPRSPHMYVTVTC